uniref:Uncharacterized protein n=2 Tax=Timema TaxID=61471 RepID=A0A7R9E3H8_9NEOP|nr:unnamed protein product [Timema monikensis]
MKAGRRVQDGGWNLDSREEGDFKGQNDKYRDISFGRYGVSGGLYSLFPGNTETSATIYSQATSAARFAHTNTYHSFIGSHKVADSLFSSGYTFGGPTPPPQQASGPPYSPVGPPVERGITQLELMAKGFNNNNNAASNNNTTHVNNNINALDNNISISVVNTKKMENKRRSECALYHHHQQQHQQETVDRRHANSSANKRRWERESQAPATPPVVKSEVTNRPSCGCRRSTVSTSSPSPLSIRSNNNGGIVVSDNNTSSFPLSLQHCKPSDLHHMDAPSGDRKKHQQHDSGALSGCSRTNPVCLRVGGAGLEWLGGGVVIKKEPGGTVTPCQVAEVTTSLRHGGGMNPPSASPAPGTPLSPLAAVIKVEAVGTASSCSGPRKEMATTTTTNAGMLQTQHLTVSNVNNIPVGIAVARQRPQDTSNKSALLLASAPDTPPLCRPHKALAPAPSAEVQCVSVANSADMGAAGPLSTMAVLQPQCEDRVANGMAPWAATNHNPALTPPTLWQYPASVPLQLGPTEHLPLPPVGYQLVRDPLSGQLLLLPTTNIEHLQRTVLWPSYPTTLQPSLHMTTATTQPAAQHIQLFEEPAEFSGGARILVQPHLTITTTTTAPPPPPLADKRGSVGKAAIIKLEDCGGGSIVDSSTAIVKAHQVTPVPVMPSRQVDVSVGTNTTCTQVFSSATTTVTPVTHYFYEHPTAVVQLAQTPQPSASVQTDSGKRSQFLVCPEFDPIPDLLLHRKILEVAGAELGTSGSPGTLIATSPVNPAETCLTPPPEVVVSQSESDDTNTSSAVASASNENQVQVQDASNQTDTPPVSEDENTESSSSKELNQEPPQAKEVECSPPQLVPSVQAPENAQEPKPVIEDVAPTYAKPSNQPVDLSGLELLSNSIEQFESHLGGSDMSKYVDTRTSSVSIEGTAVVSVLKSSPNLPTTNSDDSLQEGDSRPSAEEAAETLQLLCQQSAQLKKLEVVSTNVLEPQCCDKPLTETCDRPSDVDNKLEEAKPAEGDPLLATSESSPLGGLGLLCALAEQRFMEEVASSGIRLSRKVPLSKSAKTSEKTPGSSQATVTSGVDVNRNYKTREAEQECKKFIANKVLQYYQNGNRSGSSSPQHTVQHTLMAGVCTSPLQAELMDAMELEMRMRLAELQRKYREKQKELSKLTPRKPGSDAGSTSAVMSPDGSSNGSGSHLVKRGPGRPRKKVSKLMLDSPPVSPPSENQNISSHSRSKSSRLSGSKAKDSSSSSNRELPPPVLEKVTELTRPRSRFDSDDCAAPKLKASKLDILKPPTLTANKILSSAKFKPASSNALTSCSVASRGLKLPECNVNLVKLASGQSKVKEPTHSKNVKSGAVLSPPDSSRSSHCLLSSMDSAASLDKLSASNTLFSLSVDSNVKCEPFSLSVDSNVKCEPLSLSVDSNVKCEPFSLSVDSNVKCELFSLSVDSNVKCEPLSLSVDSNVKCELFSLSVDSNVKCEPFSLSVDSNVKCELFSLSVDSNVKCEPFPAFHAACPWGMQPATPLALSPPLAYPVQVSLPLALLSNSLSLRAPMCWAGESESLFWFKSSDKSSFGKLPERLSPVNENQKHPPSTTESPPGLLSALQSVPSSSKKRKVGRPKKHLAVTGSDLTTEMIVSKKPKSKSSLVGLLLSKNRHTSFNKPAIQSVSTNLYNACSEGGISSFSQLSNSQSRPPANPIDTVSSYNKSLSSSKSLTTTGLSSDSPANFKGVPASGIFKTTAGNVGTRGNASGPLKKGTIILGESSISDDPKPNKIRPKLKAEAKVKSWLWCEDEDAVALDWPTSTEKVTEPLTCAPAHSWTKKMEKQTEKLVTKNTTEAVNRPQKRKTVTNSESGATVTSPKIATPSAKVQNALAKTSKKTTIATATSKPASTLIRKSAPTQTSKSTSTALTKPKVSQKEKRANSNEKRPTVVEETPSNAVKKRVSATEDISTNIAKKRAASVEETSANVTKKRVTLMDETPVNPSKKHKRNSSCGHSSGGTSESDDIPLSVLSKPTPASCVLTETHLNTNKQRALTVMGGLFYAGTISAIRAPDVYGITLDGERGNRPHIFSREEILKDAQYRCLYPGTVAPPSSPDPELDSQFVSVEFDDGDNGRINIDDIRLLPADYPIVGFLPLQQAGPAEPGQESNTTSKTKKGSPPSTRTQSPASQGKTSSPFLRSCEGANEEADKTEEGRNKTEVSGDFDLDLKSFFKDQERPQDFSMGGGGWGTNLGLVDLSNRERKRLKKRRREKLKRLLSCSGDSSAKKRHRKHRCGDEHCKHKRHHRRHRKHRHRHGSRNKDSSSGGSSGESGSKTRSKTSEYIMCQVLVNLVYGRVRVQDK